MTSSIFYLKDYIKIKMIILCICIVYILLQLILNKTLFVYIYALMFRLSLCNWLLGNMCIKFLNKSEMVNIKSNKYIIILNIFLFSIIKSKVCSKTSTLRYYMENLNICSLFVDGKYVDRLGILYHSTQIVFTLS